MKTQILNCQYKKKGCQKTATHKFTVKINLRKLDKGYICTNCKEQIQNISI